MSPVWGQPEDGLQVAVSVCGERRGGLLDQSRRPLEPAGRTSAAIEQRVLALRREHPAWGGRKLRRRLQDLKHVGVPVPSTIT